MEPLTRVYQHNNLIRADLHLGDLAAKILVLSLQRIHQHDKELPKIELRITDIIPSPGGNAYRLIKAACREIFEKELSLVPVATGAKDRTYVTRIISDLDIDPSGSGMVIGTFAPKIRPYLLELSKATDEKKGGNFTYAEVTKLLTIKNANSQRLYWILKSYQSLGGVELAVDDLQALLFEADSSYPVWADFKRYVLDVAKKHLSMPEVDFAFNYEPLKTGKKTTAVKFVLPSAKREAAATKQLPAAPAAAAAPTPATGNAVLDTYYAGLMGVWGLAEWQINVLNAYFTQADADVKQRLLNVQALVKSLDKADAKGHLGAYTWGSLTKKFPALDYIKLKLYPAQSSH